VEEGSVLRHDVRLEKGRRVRGRVLAALDRAPIAGAVAVVLYPTSPYSGGRTSPCAADGGFEIDGVRADADFVVTGYAPGFSPEAAAPGRFVPREPFVESLEADVLLAASAAVAGTVVDEEGRPVAGASVVAARPDRRGAGTWLDTKSAAALWEPSPGASAPTTAEGRFRVADLRGGVEYALRASAPGFAPSGETRLSMRPGETRAAEVVLQRESVVTGRVVDERGGPVAGALVGVAILPEGALASRELPTTAEVEEALARDGDTTGADGRFEVRGLARGDRILRATRAGFARRVVCGRASGGAAADAGDVALAAGASVSGRVVTSRGAPVDGAVVLASRVPFSSMGDIGAVLAGRSRFAACESAASAVLRVSTGSDGRFVLDGLDAAGDVEVCVALTPRSGAFVEGDPGALKRGVKPGASDLEFRLQAP